MPIKVLTIDDDPGMTTLIQLFLRDEMFDVRIKNSGTDGIEAVRSWKPDVIVLDLMMPVLSGWEVCREIRLFSQTPILILSVIQEEDLLIHALNDGANGYINKPITKNELISYLKELAKMMPNLPATVE